MQVRSEFVRRVAATALGCAVLHLVSDRVLSRLFGAAAVGRLSREDRVYLGEKVVSTAHGLAVGVMALRALVARGEFSRDCFRPYPRSMDAIFGTTCGYAVYDMVVMAIHGREPASMWMHHLLTALGTFLMAAFRQAPFFPAAFSITELTVMRDGVVVVIAISPRQNRSSRQTCCGSSSSLASAAAAPSRRSWCCAC